MKKILLLAGFTFSFLSVHCQHRIGDFLAYGNSNGLPASLYYAVCQSSDGYLWIGSSSGLVRFDGKRYQIFFSDYADTNSLSDNVIVDLVEDDDHHLWIAGYYQGLSKYDLRTGLVKRYSRLSVDNTPGYGIKRLMKDHEGEIWIATDGRGLAHYLPALDSFELFIPNPHIPADGTGTNVVSDIAIDPSDGNIFWLSCFDGLYAFNRKQRTFERFAFLNSEANNASLPFLSVEPAEHKIWLGTWDDGLWSFDRITHRFDAYPFPADDPAERNRYQVLDVQTIDDSTLYLASRNLGLLSFHTKTHEMHPLLTNEMLPGGSSDIDIQRISKTQDAGVFVGGNYYIYQQHSAYNRFGNSLVFPDKPRIGLQQVIFDKTRNGYWLASVNAGSVMLVDRDMHIRDRFPEENQKEFQCIDLAIDRNQRAWAVSPFSGLLLWHAGARVFRKVAGESRELDSFATDVKCVESDEDGNLWFSTRHTVFHLDVETNTVHRFDLLPQSDVPLNELTLCCGVHHDVWVGSDKGLFHVTRDQDSVTHLMPDEKTRKGIANVLIKSMTVDKSGNAWLGFESDGVQVVSGADHRILSSYNLDHGLPGMQINHMTTDSTGGIWVGTSAGLALFNPGSEAGVWQLFNREDGVQRDYIDRPIMATRDGKLFFNIDGGISWVDLGDEQSQADRKPLLHVISIIVDGDSYQNDMLPDFLNSIELTYASKEIRIEFAAMEWLHPFRTKYFYRIEGISSSGEWIENDQATITLTGMKPGKYLFRLYAVSGVGIKSEEISLPILIRPPFWQRWWFIALCVLSILLLGYAIYRYRIRQFKKLEAMRNTISNNLHDDIGASLSNIHILTVLTQRNISNPANATSYITKAGDEIQRISESLSDIVWNISPRYDDLNNLFIRMKRYAADMLEGKSIKAKLSFPEGAEKVTMPMDQRRDFYLIFKEAINNLAKYADASEASVTVTTQHHVIRLEVSDNGKGFDERMVLSGNGMQNMKQRAEKWKAVLQVNSMPGSGTRIVLDMRVH